MAPIGFRSAMFWPLLATLIVVAYAPAQTPRTQPYPTPPQVKPAAPAADDQGMSCVVYSLRDFGDDPDLGAWIAQTIPGLIQRSSWTQEGGSGAMSYYPPAKMLVVYQTPAVHAQVDMFLKNVKKSLPITKTAATKTAASMTKNTMPICRDSGVVPATHLSVPESRRVIDSAPAAKGTYPIPAPMQQPKHLFHFIIRYEGDGVIDANVSTLAKALLGAGGVAVEETDETKPEPAKTQSLSQLFNIILRYEGEGIIDANVAELIKAIQSQSSSSCVPAARVTEFAAPAPLSSPPQIQSAPVQNVPATPSTAPRGSVPAAAYLQQIPSYATQPQTAVTPGSPPQPEPRVTMPPADAPASGAPTPSSSAPTSVPQSGR
ncbi:MAG: hypothetical protein L0Y71_14710 [Gemmataceae bacterium]|nr:hypothetical protein [Gemmataceae bacterium]